MMKVVVLLADSEREDVVLAGQAEFKTLTPEQLALATQSALDQVGVKMLDRGWIV